MPAILKFGSKGSDVITLQQQLKSLALKALKGKSFPSMVILELPPNMLSLHSKSKNLVADGKVGDKTRSALLEQNISKLLKDSDYKKQLSA